IRTYDTCVREHRAEATWLAFTDVDEFLFPADPASSLPEVVPWTLFGSARRIEKPDGLVIDNYLLRRALPECNGDTCAYKELEDD
ncbi:hypothetical protein T484DRAFT_1869551, partial [Baffinella frigidus]